MAIDNNLTADTPFDQYSRQYQVAALIDDLRDEEQTFRILDVGGYKGKTADFSPKDEVIIVDVFDVDEPNYIKGDGLDLPFESDSFDFVVNFDVLEHIPAEKRLLFLNECIRVAKRAIFISAPHKTPENKKAEEFLNNLYKDLHGEDHPWLQEHLEHTLPDFEEVEKHLVNKGLAILKLPSNDTLFWALIQGVIFLNSKFPMGTSELIKLNQYYNEHFPYDGGASLKETYRLILCAAKNEEDIEKLNDNFAKKNRPLNLSEKLGLVQKLYAYYETSLVKLTSENSNLRIMHEHEAKRAEELDKINAKLLQCLSDDRGRGVHSARKHLKEQSQRILKRHNEDVLPHENDEALNNNKRKG